jgi:hypothetical protein
MEEGVLWRAGVMKGLVLWLWPVARGKDTSIYIIQITVRYGVSLYI